MTHEVRTIVMTFEASAAEISAAAAALFRPTPFGHCIEIAAAPNPMCEAERPDERAQREEDVDGA